MNEKYVHNLKNVHYKIVNILLNIGGLLMKKVDR
jgi:hypothetical protein